MYWFQCNWTGGWGVKLGAVVVPGTMYSGGSDKPTPEFIASRIDYNNPLRSLIRSKKPLYKREIEGEQCRGFFKMIRLK